MKPVKAASLFIPLLPGWGISFLPQRTIEEIKAKKPYLLEPKSPFRVVTLIPDVLYVSWRKWKRRT